MSNATQYQFELVEVAKTLLQKQGIKEGRWTIGMAFNVGGMHAGPTPATVRPTMMVSVDKIVLSRVEGKVDPGAEGLTVDAAGLSDTP